MTEATLILFLRLHFLFSNLKVGWLRKKKQKKQLNLDPKFTVHTLGQITVEPRWLAQKYTKNVCELSRMSELCIHRSQWNNIQFYEKWLCELSKMSELSTDHIILASLYRCQLNAIQLKSFPDIYWTYYLGLTLNSTNSSTKFDDHFSKTRRGGNPVY